MVSSKRARGYPKRAALALVRACQVQIIKEVMVEYAKNHIKTIDT